MNTTSFFHRSILSARFAMPVAVGCFALLGIGCAAGADEDDGQSSSAAQGSPGGSGGAGAGPSAEILGGAAGAAGAESGGAAGAAASAGGEAGAAGAAGSGGGDDPPPMCNQGEKLCSTGCVAKGPENGCGSVGCMPCNAPPANSKGTCDGALCDFECLPGFIRKGFSCVPEGSGGSGGSGSGGSGGSGGTGGSSGSTGGTGGGLQICVAPCSPSDPTSQFFCMAACVSKGTAGLCAPALNCCVCG